MTYGYIRVSSTDQNEDRRKIAMDAKNVPRKNIFVVEHTLFALNHSRHLSKNDEMSVLSAETMVKISHFHTLFKHL